ncbi:hypothetical protein A3F66_04185 [candidate division TM6 bacterium RIFCSPHIGHO2_12_FULL_32_22]|nr:MAG: hypothetical protein A3F66_04185 [candidate division TM6 bacterium RIFCSPHIGHO2_12_FULL_32_22]
MKRIVLIFILSINNLQSETNLFIFSGCENEEGLGATHSPLLYALNSDSSPVLVSGSILRYTLENVCDGATCENLLESNLISDEFDLYYLDSYFLFIPKKKSDELSKIFNLNIMKNIDLSDQNNVKFAKTKTCMGKDSPTYLSADLLKKILKKTDTEFNIYLGGHGTFYADSRAFLENLANTNYLNRSFGLIIDNLSQRDLEDLSNDLSRLKRTSGQDFTQLLRNISHKYNLDFANVAENNISEIIYYLDKQLDIFGKLDDFFEDELNVIAGIPIEEFRKILSFLDSNINTKLLYILSCFSGGLNSILPYIDAKINLSQNKYKFDIISLSNTEYPYINVKKFIDNLIISEITVGLFNAITKNKKLEARYRDIINAFQFKAENPITFSPPIIRRKNSTEWLPLFPQIRTAKFNFYTITNILSNAYKHEGKIFQIKSPGVALVTTQCVRAPIALSIDDQILIRNLPEVYIEKLNILNPEKIIQKYKQEIAFLKREYPQQWNMILLLNILFKIFPVIPAGGILIENLAMVTASLKNVIFSKTDNKLIISYSAPQGNFMFAAEFDEYMNLVKLKQNSVSASQFKQKKIEILKKCPQLNLAEILEFIKRHHAGL